MENGRLVYNKEKVNFHLYIKEIIPSLRYIYPSHILNINSHETEVPVYIDKLRIEQVITNLLNNACKYSRPNTTINIDLLVSKQHLMQLAVSDEGIGIDEDILILFLINFTVKKKWINNYSGFGRGF
jgi:signal transduction histidine kinase